MKLMKLPILSFLMLASSCSNSDNQIIKPNSKISEGNAQAKCATPTKKTLFLAATPSYQTEIKAIIDAKCLSCHNPVSGLKKTPFLDTYDKVKASSSSAVMRMEAASNPMPPTSSPRLAAGDLSLFKSWVAASFPLTSAPAAPSAPATPKVVYLGEIDKLLKDNCTTCHSAGMNMPELATYQDVKAAARSALTEMQAGTMPTSGKMQQASIDKFKKWIDDGSLMDLTGSGANSIPAKTAQSSVDCP
ncbi:MAG: hypothetical protein WCI18_12235 [Pseudomonadota bacterium]